MFKINPQPQISFSVKLDKDDDGNQPTLMVHAQVADDSALDGLGYLGRLKVLVQNIDGLIDAEDKPLPYSEELLPLLMRQPGFIGAFFDAYNKAVVWGAEKNLKGLLN